MIKKRLTASERRARNIIWNAAGRYDFDPPFLAFFPNGDADQYFNMVIGLTDKWLDLPRIWSFFESYEYDHRAEEFDEYLWLGIENCVYEKERCERPVLDRLRRERADRFFRTMQSLSRQQMAYQSMSVFTQQQARWAQVSDRRMPLLSPREKRMYDALIFPGSLNTDGVLAAMKDFLEVFFHFHEKNRNKSLSSGSFMRQLLHRECKRHDRLFVRVGTGEGDHPRAVHQRHTGLGQHVGPTKEDADYIQGIFGPCVYSKPEIDILQEELCVHEDENCRLYITKSAASMPIEQNENGKNAEILDSIRNQQVRNQQYLQTHSDIVQNGIRSLSTRIDTIFSYYRKHSPELSRFGMIRPERAYRLAVLRDNKIFCKNGDEEESEVCVDLLLDASQSRMHAQEVLSAESYMIAKSLEKAHIPVRVCAFRSLRNYTVLEVLKDWKDRDCNGLTGYFAGGWNRDALALRTIGRMDSDDTISGKQRILLILTDASPNDSAPLPSSGFLTKEYEGAPAVKAAENAVRQLRRDGLRVGAVFHGSTSHLDHLNQIYGHAYVRIQKPSQLAQGVSDLLLMLLREIRND